MCNLPSRFETGQVHFETAQNCISLGHSPFWRVCIGCASAMKARDLSFLGCSPDPVYPTNLPAVRPESGHEHQVFSLDGCIRMYRLREFVRLLKCYSGCENRCRQTVRIHLPLGSLRVLEPYTYSVMSPSAIGSHLRSTLANDGFWSFSCRHSCRQS